MVTVWMPSPMPANEYTQKVVWQKIALGPKAELLARQQRPSITTLSAQHCRPLCGAFSVNEQQSIEKEKQAESECRRYIFLEHLAERRIVRFLRDQLLSTLLGGRDMTSTLVSKLFWALARSKSL